LKGLTNKEVVEFSACFVLPTQILVILTFKKLLTSAFAALRITFRHSGFLIKHAIDSTWSCFPRLATAAFFSYNSKNFPASKQVKIEFNKTTY
jgi:hypothetical protein